MRSRCEYLTARCPFGCEVWLHPQAVNPHRDRCPGRRWTDNRLPVTQTLLDDEQADLARQIFPPEPLQRPNFSGDRFLNPRPGMYLRDRLVAGAVVQSPLEGVTGRRWWTVLRTAHDQGWSTDLTLELASFQRLEQQLGLTDHFASCDVCGDDITPKRMKNHLKTNSVCRFLVDTAEVRTFWELGYRDRYLVQSDGVPITWTELNSRVAWRNRLHVVRFGLWTAVMIHPFRVAPRLQMASRPVRTSEITLAVRVLADLRPVLHPHPLGTVRTGRPVRLGTRRCPPANPRVARGPRGRSLRTDRQAARTSA